MKSPAKHAWKSVSIKKHYHDFIQRRYKYHFNCPIKNRRHKNLFVGSMRSWSRMANFVMVNVNVVSPSLRCRYFSFHEELSHCVYYQGLQTISKAGCYICRYSGAIVTSAYFQLLFIFNQWYTLPLRCRLTPQVWILRAQVDPPINGLYRYLRQCFCL